MSYLNGIRLRTRGNVGLIVLLLVLLVIGILVMKNMQSMQKASTTSAGDVDVSHPNTIINKFKGDVKEMETREQQNLPKQDPN